MATTDDNDNQGSSTGGVEISVDDIETENNSPCNVENTAYNTVDMTTKDQNSSIPLNLTSSRLDSLVPFPDDNLENNTANSSQSSQTSENVRSNDEEAGDENAPKLVHEKDNLTQELAQKLPDSSECEAMNIAESEDKIEREGDDSGSCLPNQSVNVEVDGEGQSSQGSEHGRNSDAGENDGGIEKEGEKEAEEDHGSALASNCEESMDSPPQLTPQDVASPQLTPQDVGDDDEASERDKVAENRSATSTPQFTAIINSDESCSQDPLVHNMVCDDEEQAVGSIVSEEQGGGSIVSEQNSQSSLGDEPPELIPNETECFIRLDEETFKEWCEKRKKMGFGSDAEMATFLLKRLAVHGISEGPSYSQDSTQERSKVPKMESSQTKQCEVVKKKTSSLGGIESIVRRLHKVRTDTTPETSQPGSDNEGVNNSDIVKIKTEPEETCNNDDVDDPAVPKKATTSIYSSGRNGRKRVYVKREPGVDEWMQNAPHSDDYDQQVNDYANHWPPVRIKQEKLDPSEAHEASEQSADGEEKPKTLGQFVRSAASWVSHLVASELEKPQEEAAAPVPDTPETLFSDSRLHRIIEEQLGKASEPSMSEKRLHSVIEEQLNKPTPQVDCILLEKDSKAIKKEMKKARKEARQAKKLKKAQKREREKDQQYRETQQSYSPFERPLNTDSVSPYNQSYSPFEKSTSPFQSSISPFDKSHSPFETTSRSPFEKPPSQEPVSASHALESFARMVQIREFQGGSQIMQQTPQKSATTGLQKSPPIPTALHTSAHLNMPNNANIPSGPTTTLSENYSPSSESADQSPDNATAVHPASLALKSFAQRSSTILQTEKDDPGSRGASPYQEALSEQDKCSPKPDYAEQPLNADIPSSSPLEKLLKVAETPHQSAKSQLEHLLKAKNIKEQWSKPSSHAGQQIPYHVTQAQTSYSSHILKVPKVTLSGRTIKETSYDSPLIRGPAFDHILAATGIGSDSDDSDARDAKERNKDPDWQEEPEWGSSPKRKQKSRKRSLNRPTDVIADSTDVIHLPSQRHMSSLVFGSSPDGSIDTGAKQTEGRVQEAIRPGEPSAKHQKLNNDGTVQSMTPIMTPNELTATNTLARLLQMATKNNQESKVQPTSCSSPSTPKTTTAVSQGQGTGTPSRRDFTPKQSAFGAMQAFAQLVEIQGRQPEIQAKQPEIKANLKKPREKLSDSLPPIISAAEAIELMRQSESVEDKSSHGHNGGKHQDNFMFSTKVNGSGANMHDNDLDEPEDLTMHSRIQIKMEPIDVDDDDDVVQATDLSGKYQHHVNISRQEEPLQYTCSLCSQIFSSVSEVTDHKLRIHYSSNFEIVS